ncbi:hypothetical protein ANCCEY_14906 [Ancylostoma ceylanicum]|uniref:Uncharacterized protein n=1 Tax=Ancylostoma ceylanicum TaxID=53326 RepID=A0A0D6L8P6_9BILA|nr:hypothetical protein ANCCEY_14906 [Ancylostoma ceylanicum]
MLRQKLAAAGCSYASATSLKKSSSNGKPTFIRFGKRAQPSFIRFGRAQPSFIRFGRQATA